MVCSHELGHAVLHPKSNILFLENHTFCVKNRFEREANRFAAELLIPDDVIYKYPNYTIEQVAAEIGIDEKLLILKFNIDL
jgi:Zn-dependent peptidase ImmA (M78 family)